MVDVYKNNDLDEQSDSLLVSYYFELVFFVFLLVLVEECLAYFSSNESKKTSISSFLDFCLT